MTYNEFIQNIIKTRGQWNIPDGEYFEKHHIIPKCIGGSNDNQNIIWLYPREHFIAHKLLAEENSDIQPLQYAYWRMATKDRSIITDTEYEECRLKLLNIWSQPKSDETKLKMRKPKSKLHRQHMSEARKGLKYNKHSWNYGLTKYTNDSVMNYSITISNTLKQKYADGVITPWNKGLTKEIDKRIAESAVKGGKSRKGHKWSEKRALAGNKSLCKRVICEELNIIFNSIKEAGEALNLCSNNISLVCKGKRKSVGGYHFRYYDESINKGTDK